MERLRLGCMTTWDPGLIMMLQASRVLQWLIVLMEQGRSLVAVSVIENGERLELLNFLFVKKL